MFFELSKIFRTLSRTLGLQLLYYFLPACLLIKHILYGQALFKLTELHFEFYKKIL